MIGLDSNVLVRYVMQDDPKQSARAVRLVDTLTVDEPGFIALTALVEFVWVLESCYNLNRTQITEAVEGVLRSKEFVIERSEQIMQALRQFTPGSADFADCVIERCGASAGCERTITFDAAAAKGAGMSLIA